ncbi:hypothetical protein DVH24_001178 [Malus domestica]|uniref:Replication factor A C-terminal domain-containing protein n=1 Tax=Malus domestica TaxID=3750 RepID=A0A498K3Q5_MALDO|nr:hypothetical protein DVH24_001178 [Malus domestica]
MIPFTGETIFKKLASDYYTLYPQLNRVDILTSNNIYIYVCIKKELNVTLWGDVAKNLCSLSMRALSAPIVVFTSLKVKVFVNVLFMLFPLFFQFTDKIVLNTTGSSLFFLDLDIPKLNSFKSVWVNEAQILQTAKRVTIDELAFLDLDLYKDDTFLCKASIRRFDTRFDWSYNACPNCIQRVDNWFAKNIPIRFQRLGNMYKVNLILEDHTNEIIALVIGKSGEKLFGVPCNDLVLN